MAKSQKYAVIHNTEDGEVGIDFLSKSALTKRLNEDYWGEGIGFFSRPPDTEPGEWDSEYILILKVEIVVPKPKKVVETYDVD